MVLTIPDAGTYEPDVKTIGRQLLDYMGVQPPSLLQPDWWQTQALDVAARDPEFRRRFLEFLEVFPALKSVDQMASHLREYFEDPSGELPPVLRWGIKAAWPGQLTTGLVAKTIEHNLHLVTQIYIAGRSPAEAIPVLRRLRKDKAGFIVNILGEHARGTDGAVDAKQAFAEALQHLVREAARWTAEPQVDDVPWGSVPRACLSLKLSSICPGLDPIAFDAAHETAADVFRPLFRLARDQRVALLIDLEQFRLRDLTQTVFSTLLTEPEFRNYPHFGITVQAYLRDVVEDVMDLVTLAQERSAPMIVRIVKGAYWDEEIEHSLREGWPSPVMTHKADTDTQFERMTRLLIEHSDTIRPAVATHNPRSVACALSACRAAGLPDTTVEFQLLLGVAQSLCKAMSQLGLRHRIYVPVGDLRTGMSYLARRMLEATSPESFLRTMAKDDAHRHSVLARPLPTPDIKLPPLDRLDIHPTNSEEPGSFHNEPRLDFARDLNRLEMKDALAAVGAALGAHRPLRIAGHAVETGRQITSVNPAHPNQELGTTAAAGAGEAERAVQAARSIAPSWRSYPAVKRAEILFRAADLLRRERCRLAALVILEAGKTWREADADVIEAIDFLEYYGRDLLRLAAPQVLGASPGETNRHRYEPRGVAAVIAPWNFPLAILGGMTAAALAAGNTVIMKPASDTPLVAWEFYHLLAEAGLPEGVLSYLPGPGSEVGAYLVRHPEVDVVAFTGSSAVGLEMVREAAVMRPGQVGIKHVVAEMGGKNAIIVDDDADLGAAADAVAASAFGFSGQKCSACSRVVVLESVRHDFLQQLLAATSRLTVGDPALPGTDLGPLINPQALEKVNGYIARGQEDAEPLFAGTPSFEISASGYYVAPHIFTNVDMHSVLAQDEIFGPVLSVITVRDFTTALSVANAVQYGLTGGVFTRTPSHVRLAEEEFRVGNLYINRGITGAMVGRQPFGGFKHSGTGSRTGGPDYLRNFMEARTITERTRLASPQPAYPPRNAS